MISDRKIIEGCLAGKRRAHNLLYKKYAVVMMSVCMRYSKDRAEAEDVLQEGFIKVFQKIGQFRMQGSLEGWIRRIIVNTAINHYHLRIKCYNQQDVEDLPELPDNDQEGHDLFQSLNGSLSKESLMEMIQALPNGYRVVFNLFAIEGHTHKEIASLLEISENTSKTQLMKARRTLKNMIKEIQNKDLL